MRQLTTKPTKWYVRPAKTQISLGIHPVSESSLSAWRKLGSLAAHRTHSEDSGQTGRMPKLIWVLAGRTDHFFCFVVRWLKWNEVHENFCVRQYKKLSINLSRWGKPHDELGKNERSVLEIKTNCPITFYCCPHY